MVFFGQLVLAQGEPGEKGEGVAGKAQNEGQEEIGPVDAGNLQPEEGREGPADKKTAARSRHNLAELHFAALFNGAEKSQQDYQHDNDGQVVIPVINPSHRNRSGYGTHTHQLTPLHAADTTLELHTADTRQEAQRRHHHPRRRSQDHIQQRRDAHGGYQDS